MEYRYLKAFLLTAQYQSFSKAADALKIAQSAVSRQIKLLEESVGEELIIRSSKKVILTDKGSAFFLAAQQFDQVGHDIFKKENDGPIKIGILNGLLNTWFLPRLIKYCKQNQRQISVRIGTQKELKNGIDDGSFDIIFSSVNIQSELISSLKLFDEKLVLISKEKVDKKKLHEHTWIVYSDEDNLYKASKKPSQRIINIEDIHSIIELVKANTGIAIIPDHCLQKNDNLIIEEVKGLAKAEIYMTTLNYKNIPSHLKEMFSLVV